MRVTNKMLSNNFLNDMRRNLSNLSTIQGQSTSGKQIRKASDNPAKAYKIMQINSDISANKQYNTNITNTSNWLDVTDTALGQIGDSFSRIEELLQSAGNGGYTSDERKAVKDEINQKIGELSQKLNTSFDGKYIFGGTSGTTKPADTNANGENTELICTIKPKAVTKLIDGGVSYGGKTVGKGSTFNMSINGVSMPVTTTSDITSETTTMDDTATILETSINNTIDATNIANGKITGQEGFIPPSTVKSTGDGGYTITPEDTMTFSDNGGNTVTKDLGLSKGPNKLLVEVSQGVTMDYNITASQVINYGTGDNNLIDLMKNITKHLDSTDPTEISKLIGEDLTGIKDAKSNVLSLRSEVGAKQNSMESAATRNDDQNFNMTEILSKAQDVNITEKAMEYATMQTIYLASLQTSAKVLQPSLLDYL